ncbi:MULTISPECIES: GTP-binding protein [unclassified Bradyrhizobium]|uniref:CobW family GTP-binding protein n=1 Tax=unclassified Bradyrhizobium TaxID=2631580 RepID=UPI001CD52EC2|nr:MULTISPECIES: GTP-binding protein [unclassified Bradyrhizobium]MCA1386134.1 GTP-binding protein [Bradyrhizobium sp. BRP05]MCA1394215.1 GTP-binding protein [Bradyrhizobium sp. IC3123]MCA1423674.1 GTP-binding protein [Bradyrhizobium sp. BRP23]MCA1430686.1 GTP-binding protein [Bradyrhizobium sp. NBAIM16]MCA1480291.1 GTP-binding protein [Bradyrhizobium sp. NBAIM08]
MSVDVIIIGGYLGSGKSSLVNHLLQAWGSKETGVIVNDLAPINIDAQHVISEAGLTLGIQDGCVCCSVTDRLGEAFDWMTAFRPRLKRILVEASGVGDPRRISYYSRGLRELSLSAMITVIDASSFVDRLNDRFVGKLVQRQIEAADRLILNKIDLVHASRVSKVEAILRELNQEAVVVRTRHSQVDASAIYLRDGIPILTRLPSKVLPAASDAELSGTAFSTMVLRTKDLVDQLGMRESLSQLAKITERIKGVIVTSEEANNRYLVQVAAGDVQLSPANPLAAYPETVLVFVLSGDNPTLQKEIIETSLSKRACWTSSVIG